MVIPTIGRPWRTRSAATVELSTPPLIATAMGSSGMHGNPAEMCYRRANRLDQRIDLLRCVPAAQRKTHAGTGAVISESDGSEHVRGRERTARTGRARRDSEAAQIERNDHRFAIHAVEVDIAR